MGSRSRSLKSNFSVIFPEDGNTDELKRNFNFGVLKSTGIFYNRSCERSLGRDYLGQLSAIIPNTEVRIHPNEFRNSIVQKNGDPVPLEWIVSRRKEWLQLVGDFLSKLKRQDQTLQFHPLCYIISKSKCSAHARISQTEKFGIFCAFI